MSYAASYSGPYGAGYAPGTVGPMAPGDETPVSATIEAPPTTETSMMPSAQMGPMMGPPRPATKQDYMQEFFGNGEEIDEFHPRTLYVGNLDISISEEFLMQLFSQIGPVNKCKIIHETANDPYAFIEFQEHVHAVQALTAMNKRVLMGKEMRVNWATSPGAQQRIDTSKHYHVFVGDLSPEIDNRTLRDAFTPFGQISDVKVIRDLQTLKSKGYGFVSYVDREDAERAIEQMNGQWLGRRAIRTNWATRKPGMPGPSYGVREERAGGNTRGSEQGDGSVDDGPPRRRSNRGNMNLEEIMAQASPTNCTVYVGGVGGNTSDDDLRQVFVKYGNVIEVRVFRQQGYAFVRFDQKEAAGQAIYNVNNTEINGSSVRCSWGKEGGYASSNSQYPNYGYGYGYGYGGGQGGGGGSNAPSNAPNPQNNQQYNNYWNQYYQYYNNPAVYQQWQAYWQQGGQGGPQ